jgi:hypothetical protein
MLVRLPQRENARPRRRRTNPAAGPEHQSAAGRTARVKKVFFFNVWAHGYAPPFFSSKPIFKRQFKKFF